MLLAALYELLEDKSAFLDTMNGLGLPGVHLEAVPGTTCGIAGTHMRVTVHGEEEHEPAAGHGHGHAHGHDHAHPHEHAHAHAHHHATPGHIAEIIDGLTLPDAVKQHARSVYDAIAVAEAKAHGCPVGDVPLPRGGGFGRGGRRHGRVLRPASASAGTGCGLPHPCGERHGALRPTA